MTFKSRLLFIGFFLAVFFGYAQGYADPVNSTDTASLPQDSFYRSQNGLGLDWNIGFYHAATNGVLGGKATVIGAFDQSDRTFGTLAGEASGRQAVVLTNLGDSLTFSVNPQDNLSNALVIRYSIPDAPNGGGQDGFLSLSIRDRHHRLKYQKTLTLTSRFAWQYGKLYGQQNFNVQANAIKFNPTTGTADDSPMHLYDEAQLLIGPHVALRPGDTLTFTKGANSAATTITIDFMELEQVSPPLTQPAGSLSYTADCGGVALDKNGTGQVFDGVEDAAYASVFNWAQGVNLWNPPNFTTQEKDYYTNAPSDSLQDNLPNSSVVNSLSMFALADHNQVSLNNCIQQAAVSGQSVWVPPGRYYIRGKVNLVSNTTIIGASAWYTKFVAVDTEPPQTYVTNGVTWIRSKSGNMNFSSVPGPQGASLVINNVHLSGFSMFGNVTQRDSLDDAPPNGIVGAFSNSVIRGVWIEHYRQGIVIKGASQNVRIESSRVRNMVADGYDFFDSTSNSSITNSQARSTGDDGFAMWSGTWTANNTFSHSWDMLNWFSNGFAIYGGANNALQDDAVSDALNYDCVLLSTKFINETDPALPPMTAKASDMVLARCGSNANSETDSGIQVGSQFQPIGSAVLKNIKIYDPTYNGVVIRSFATTTPPVSNTVTLDDFLVVGAPTCGVVATNAIGSAAVNNFYTLNKALTTTQTSNCVFKNLDPSHFIITQRGRSN